jgi:hypothetical protein
MKPLQPFFKRISRYTLFSKLFSGLAKQIIKRRDDKNSLKGFKDFKQNKRYKKNISKRKKLFFVLFFGIYIRLFKKSFKLTTRPVIYFLIFVLFLFKRKNKFIEVKIYYVNKKYTYV